MYVCIYISQTPKGGPASMILGGQPPRAGPQGALAAQGAEADKANRLPRTRRTTYASSSNMGRYVVGDLNARVGAHMPGEEDIVGEENWPPELPLAEAGRSVEDGKVVQLVQRAGHQEVVDVAWAVHQQGDIVKNKFLEVGQAAVEEEEGDAHELPPQLDRGHSLHLGCQRT